MFSTLTEPPKDPNRDRKRCEYQCPTPDCGTAYTFTLDKGDRKLKRWCKNCRHFIYPIRITHITSAAKEARVSKPKSLW